jgi:ribose/xylose/arabinose/galactoside ABC-type transport system permease subunit
VSSAAETTRPLLLERGRLLLSHPDITALATLALAIAVFSATAEGFATWTNLRSVLITVSITAVVACGENLVILGREIDVSVGSILAVAAFVSGRVAVDTGNIWLTVLVALAVGAAAGSINGLLVSCTPVPSIVVTLGTLYAFRGAALLFANNRNIEDVPSAASGLGSGKVLGIPNPVLVAIATFLVVTLVRRNTNRGRDLIAAGGNRRAAQVMGVRVREVIFCSFVVSGLLAGLGAAMYLGEQGGVITSVGSGFELEVIAACAIGGTSIRGGRGTDLAPVIGAVFLGVITNGIIILGVPGVWIPCAYGAFIILAVARDRVGLTHWVRRRAA